MDRWIFFPEEVFGADLPELQKRGAFGDGVLDRFVG